ncbi:MAG TPA: hypothetical protein DDY77_02220 [Clostridiales bacterium]|jgi:hypothetical protein|nr:hypothetical protein [Clostridiales bacterium]
MKPYKEIEMKLNRDRFEIFAKEQGYKDGVELFETLGYSADEYEYYADGEYIDREMLLDLYIKLGASNVLDFIEFGSGYEWENNIDLFDEI